MMPALFMDDMKVASHYAANEKAESTRRCYKLDIRIFTAWCRARGAEPLPATPDVVATFLASQAKAGLKASTIGRRCAAIAYAHKLAGMEPPTNAEALRAVLRGIRRTIGAKPNKKVPATHNLVTAMVGLAPDTLRGKRDRALLLLGFAAALRRSELVALTVADLVEVQGGLRVQIRRSKTDQEGQGHEVAVPAGGKLRVAEAVREWLDAAGISEGPVFRSVRKGGGVGGGALTHQAVVLTVKAYAERAGLDPAQFSGHSLRSGFLTSAAEAGAGIFKMMEVSRHKSVDTLRGVRAQR
jgi:site-specific recombinase XerD